ncbi:MAG: molybdate ABC transporter substrate-binding protein [Deltaproteobacteria bacterium]|nr:molybdate ABC transporter substrate-binding protein [Deltaproteobacteria bacterium]
MRRRAALALLGLLFLGCHRGKNEEGKVEVSVGAASSLRVVLPKLVEAFGREHRRPKVVPVYGASGDLRKRIQDGAPIDVVLFAAPEPVDKLIETGNVIADSRKVVAHNRLALIGPKGGPKVGWHSLETLAPGDKIAIGDPEVVPAGAYAKKALQALGQWDSLAGRLVFGGDVAAVLAYVRRGEVAAGVVYMTEIKDVADVLVLEEARGAFAPRADVVAGSTKGVEGASHAGPARSFVEFLSTREAREIFEANGFELPR